MSKIEQLISEIEAYIDECKPQPFTNNKKIIVEKDVIDELLVELRMRTPDEIKKYQKIISNKDAILSDVYVIIPGDESSMTHGSQQCASVKPVA